MQILLSYIYQFWKIFLQKKNHEPDKIICVQWKRSNIIQILMQ